VIKKNNKMMSHFEEYLDETNSGFVVLLNLQNPSLKDWIKENLQLFAK
jgi:hypothetical protein